MQEYPRGTIEYLVVDVKDRLEAIEDLDAYGLSFDVYFRETGEIKYENEEAENDGMKIKCLIDTTDWDPGPYQLFTTINATPESPRLGPFEFRIVGTVETVDA